MHSTLTLNLPCLWKQRNFKLLKSLLLFQTDNAVPRFPGFLLGMIRIAERGKSFMLIMVGEVDHAAGKR
jgi:hypothetical protein